MNVEEGRAERVAFFGGSFDPPHLGHLAVARAAREALRLDRVLFAPVGAQPLKPQGSTASFPDRVQMTGLAIAGEPGFEVSLLDAPDREGKPNYTVQTLRRLRSELGPGSTLFCLMGADSFVSLRRWHAAAEIPFAAHLVVASRPGQHLRDLAELLADGLALETDEACASAAGSVGDETGTELRCYRVRDAGGRSAPFYLLPGLDVEISATDIRRQGHAGEAEAQLPRGVAEYIRTHGLYL